MFKPLAADFPDIQFATFGEGKNSKLTVIKLNNGPDEWEKIDRTNILIIGGKTATARLREYFQTHTITDFRQTTGAGGGTTDNLRTTLGIATARK